MRHSPLARSIRTGSCWFHGTKKIPSSIDLGAWPAIVARASGEGRTAMNREAIEKAGDILWQARLAGQRLESLPSDCKPRTVDEGYEIQDRIAAQSGRSVLGWKIALTTEAGRRRLGVTEPLGGRLLEGFVVSEGERLNAGQMNMRAVEAEFAFLLGQDLRPRARPYDGQEILAAVADLHLAIEVPDSRFEHHATMDAADMTADDGFAGWFVLGPKLAAWRKLDLPNQKVRVSKNGRVAGESSSTTAMGNPFEALSWLVNDRAKRGEALSAGNIITTGTRLPPVAIHGGDEVTVEFDGLGKVNTAFD